MLFQVAWVFLHHITTVCRWYVCCRIKHEGDCESQGQVGRRILSEELGSSKENSWNEDQQREKELLKISQAEYIENVLKRFNMYAKPVNVPLGGYFKLSKAHGSDNKKWECSHVKCIICISCGHLDVCYSLHEARNCLSNGSCQHVYEQSRERVLRSNKVNL